MQPSSQITMRNRTGLQMSPKHGKELLETVEDAGMENVEIVATALVQMRTQYINEAEPIGTIPPPGTAKGMAKSSAKMLTGSRPQVFIDKLAERCAFERGGTRLYEALLTKFSAETAGGAKEAIPPEMSEARLREIHDQEAQHFEMLADCIVTLGADPTAQTPSADLVGVETMGLIQAVGDARTSIAQSLHAVLAAELIDGAGWEMLVEMAEEMKYDDMARRFRTALLQEQEHLHSVRTWYGAMTMADSGNA